MLNATFAFVHVFTRVLVASSFIVSLRSSFMLRPSVCCRSFLGELPEEDTPIQKI